MSYSRWGGSVWYTFWSCSDNEEQAEQMFEVCGLVRFSYKELKEDLNACLEKVKQLSSSARPSSILTEITEDRKFIYKEVMINPTNYSLDEYEELRGYMETFLKDVEREYANG